MNSWDQSGLLDIVDEKLLILNGENPAEVKSCEERSDELQIRQLRSQFVCTSSDSFDIDATITAT